MSVSVSALTSEIRRATNNDGSCHCATLLNASGDETLPSGTRVATVESADHERTNAMQATQSDYFSAYRQLKLTRDAKGVLVVEFHSNGGPCIMNAQAHTEFIAAFYGT